jgi:predicted permease
MLVISGLLFRVRALFRRKPMEAALDEEIQSHLRMAAKERMERGETAEQARNAALREFGNVGLVKEITREMWGWGWVETLLQDVRYGLRMLARNPGFAAVAVLTLGLGIGANTAIFSVMNAALLRYLPVPNPRQLFYLQTAGFPNYATETGNSDFSFNEASFEQFRNEHGIFSDVMAYVPLAIEKASVRYGEEPEEASVDMVSGNFFSGLGVRAERGCTFTLDDESRHRLVAVLSDGYWSRRLGRDPSVIGRTLYVKGIPFTIIGVAAHDFIGVERGTATDLWIPFQSRPDLTPWGQPAEGRFTLYGAPKWWFLMMVGRLAPGMDPKEAAARLNPIFERSAYEGMGARNPKEKPPRLYLTPLRGAAGTNQGLESALLVLMAMVILVLVIACINVALLLVARNSARQREFSVRMALGAGGTHLFRQLLTESALLVAGGTALGWIFTIGSSRVLASWAGLDFSVAPDRTVLGFTLIISALAALVFSLAPMRNALWARAALALKPSAATTYQARGRLPGGRFVVALQISLCLVLLVSAGLLLRSLRNLETTKLGMRAQGLLVFGITSPQTLRAQSEVNQFFQRLTERLRPLPGMESVTFMENRLGSGWDNYGRVFVDGTNPRGAESSMMQWNSVGPDYFHVLGTPLLLGRDFSDADTSSAPKVVIINQTFADRYLHGKSPLGHHVSGCDDPQCAQSTIVGVAADSKYTGVREQHMPMAYFPYRQAMGTRTMHFDLRTEGGPTALLPEVRRVVREFGPDIPLLQPMTQQAQFEHTYSEERLFARLSTFFGLLAALLVATGLYGTLAYRVSRRTAELGVRMALGAQRRQVLWMVLRESLVVSVAGTLVGLPLAIGAARALRSILFGVGPNDPLAFAAAFCGMLLVALLAGYIPARRATKVDPMVALRYE